MKVLQIDVKILTQPVRLAGPCMIEVRITNRSGQPVVLNKRLAVGYKDSLSRELYFEVFETGSSEIVGRESLLYERPLSSPEDYVPGGARRVDWQIVQSVRMVTVRSPGEY